MRARALLDVPAREGLVPLAVAAGTGVTADLLLEVPRLADGTAWPVPVVPVLLLSAVPLALATLLVAALLGRVWVASSVVLTLCTYVGIADRLKLQLRDEPLFPSDLAFLRDGGFLAGMVGPRDLALFLLFGLVVGAVPLMAGRVLRRPCSSPAPAPTPGAVWRRTAARALVALTCAACLLSLAHFHDPGSPARRLYEAAGAQWQPWSQRANYGVNGVVAGFLWNLDVTAMQQPPGYSRQTMDRLVRRWARRAESFNVGRRAGALRHVNVVIVLGETFGDPTRLRDLTVPEDPIPFTRSLMARTPSGQTLSRDPGGGTANMEFEALTGMSLAEFDPGLTTPYQMLVPRFATFPSVVGFLGNTDGRQTVAIHPSGLSAYRRNDVYPRLGFDTVIDDRHMHHPTHLEDNGFISDASAFGEVLRRLRTAGRPQLVNLVTIQNHFPMAGKYRHPWPVSGPLSPDQQAEAGGFLRGLHYTDSALRGFLASLDRLDEPTAVIFYGDHRAGFWPPSVQGASGDLTMRTTPYFLWANQRLGRLPTSPAPADESISSPIYFVPHLLDRMGARLPPYYVLLDELSRAVPALEGDHVVLHDRLVPRTELSPSARRLLHDYRLVQYDLAVGRRYSEHVMFPQEYDAAAQPPG